MSRRPLLITVLIALTGCAGPSEPLPHTADISSRTRRLYVAKCAKCHKLHDPASYTEADWHNWMVKMSRKAKLKPDQEQLLTRYLESVRQARSAKD